MHNERCDALRVVRRLGEQLSESGRAFRDVFRNPNLRRLELAAAGSVVGYWAYGIALAVYAYDKGGAAAVGIVGLLRLLPAAVAAPFASLLGDRYPRARVMLAADLGRAIVMAAAAAAVFADGPALLVYALSALVAVMSTAFFPAQGAILPSLATTPEELTAANVTSSTIDSAGSFVGPALGGIVLATAGTGVVFALTAATFLWSGVMVVRIRVPKEEQAERATTGEGLLREAFAGFRAIGSESRLRLLVGLYGAQMLVGGLLNVLIVVAALDLLDLGDSGVGFLNSAVGIGGLLGALAAVALVGRRRLSSPFGFGIVLLGLPLALLGIFPDPPIALVLLAIVGVGNTIVDVAGLTLLQRSVADDVLARVFGVLESLIVATLGIGAILAPLLIVLLGIRGALIATGALLPVLAALFWRRLATVDAAAAAPGPELELLRSVPMFAPLPAATIEHLAGSLVPARFAAGSVIFRQADAGDRFYVVADGELEVSIDGRSARTLGPGDYFGEIALLRDVPRTATVTARSDVEAYALERDEFIGAVTGHAPSAEAADAVIGARLGSLRPGVASV